MTAAPWRPIGIATSTVTIRTRTVGQCFGTVGQIVDLKGDVVAETAVCGYGFDAAALDLARSLAASRGWTVRS